MADSFASQTFHSHDTGSGTKPKPFAAPIYTVTHIPGSNNQVIDAGGVGETRLKVPCVVSAAQFTNLQALQGVFATLVYDGVTYTNAFMSACDEVSRVVTADKVFVGLEFILG